MRGMCTQLLRRMVSPEENWGVGMAQLQRQALGARMWQSSLTHPVGDSIILCNAWRNY